MLIALSLATALAAPAPPIVGGEVTSIHPEAVFLYIGGGTCTGTLIDPEWVLTAAHCVYDAGNLSRSRVYVGADPWAGDVDDQTGIEAVYSHPNYRGSTANGYNAGLVHLSSPLTGVTPGKLTNEPLTQDWVGMDVRYVGYGVTEENANDSGTKRTVVVPFYQLDSDWMYTFDEGHNMCWGDSGGPAFVETEHGTAVAGIISWVSTWTDTDHPCTTGWGSSTRIDLVKDWIEEYVDVGYVEDVEEVDTGTPADDTGGPDGDGGADGGSSDGGEPDGEDTGSDGADAGDDPPAQGCCSTTGQASGMLAALLSVMVVMMRRRDDLT